MIALAIAVAIVIIGSALCSGTEAALFSAPATAIEAKAEDGDPRAKVLAKIKKSLHRPIAAIVILNNIFNIVGAIAVGAIAAQEFGNASLGWVSGILTACVIIFSEIVPKTLGERHAMKIGLAAAPLVRVLTWLLTPILVLVDFLPINKGVQPTVNSSEILVLANQGMASGGVARREAEMIKKTFALKETSARDIMTPRVRVDALEKETPLSESKELLVSSPHSRIIIYDGSIDDVAGVALKSQMLAMLIEGEDACVGDLAREAVMVPLTATAEQLLASFRQTRQHLHVVLDEHGGMAGIVTLEDVLELLTGEILDETDKVADLAAEARREGKRLERMGRS